MPKCQNQRATTARAAIDPSYLQRRLARALADMVEGAATLRVSQCDPGKSWPSPFLRAYDEHGRLIPVTRVRGLTAARWIIRAHPGTDWSEPHDFDLATATLNPSVRARPASNEVN